MAYLFTGSDSICLQAFSYCCSWIEQPRFFCLLNFPLQGKAVLVLPGGCWIILQNGNMWCCQIVGGQEASCWYKINFPPWFISIYFSKKCLSRRTLGVVFMFTCVAMSAVNLSQLVRKTRKNAFFENNTENFWFYRSPLIFHGTFDKKGGNSSWPCLGRNMYDECQEGAAYNWSFTNKCVEISVHSFSFFYLGLIFSDKMK